MVDVLREVCTRPVEPDGMRFDPDSVRGARTRPEEEYQGVQLHLQGHLGQARTALKVDIGFGDTVVPGPVDVEYAPLLDFPPPRLRGYTRESVVAEKFQAHPIQPGHASYGGSGGSIVRPDTRCGSGCAITGVAGGML